MLSKNQKYRLGVRYPDWKKQIASGDFRVEVVGGTRQVVWPNTTIFSPTFLDINAVVSTEFRAIPHRLIVFTTGTTSLTISGPNRKRNKH